MPKTITINGKRYTFKDGSRVRSYCLKIAHKLRLNGYSAHITYEPDKALKYKVFAKKK